MPRVSVVIPTYNRASLIREALESVFAQTFRDFEVIVVDDGSTDGTVELLKEYEGRIAIIRQENRGAGAARNRGLAEATGEYIAFIDSDDLWMDFKLDLQVAILEGMPDVGFLYSDFQVLKDAGKRLPRGLGRWHHDPDACRRIFRDRLLWPGEGKISPASAPIGDFWVYRGNIYRALLNDPFVLPSSTIVRRGAIPDGVRFAEDIRVYEDWLFFAQFARSAEAAFMDLETTLNRGHRDAVRLMLSDETIKAVSRLKLIEKVWRADGEFFAAHREEVHRAERDQVLLLARNLIMDRRASQARDVLAANRVAGLRYRSMEFALLAALATLPGAPEVLARLRDVRNGSRTRRSA